MINAESQNGDREWGMALFNSSTFSVQLTHDMAVTEQSKLAMALTYQSANCHCFSLTETVMSYIKELSIRKQPMNRIERAHSPIVRCLLTAGATNRPTWLPPEPPTFERTQQTFSQVKSFAFHKLVW